MTAAAFPYYKALAARDPRFDGLFFVGVSSTGIYCRPVCTARTPKAANCRFFDNAQTAELAGFRPCLRCRPELAPGCAPLDRAQRIAHAFVRRIEQAGVDEDLRLDSLAQHMAVGARQMRRIVRRQLGVPPIQLLQTRRLLLAKQLLTETSLPVTRIAYASGFASLRRFNDAFVRRYALTPSRLRRSAGMPDGGAVDCSTLQLVYRPPLDFPATLDFLRLRALRGVEVVSDTAYERTVRIGEHEGWIRVAAAPAGPSLHLTFTNTLVPVLPELLARVRDLFDLDARPDVIHAHLRDDATLCAAAPLTPGLRVPGCFDGFELAWRAVLGQQISVVGATTLAARIVAAHARPVDTGRAGLTHLTPAAQDLLRVPATKLGALGIVGARSRALLALARAHAEDRLPLEGVQPDPEAATAAITGLPGIGAWTAHYIAMRALRWPDAFPAGDAALRKALGGITARTAEAMAQAWSPWRSYAAIHLWRSLSRRPSA